MEEGCVVVVVAGEEGCVGGVGGEGGEGEGLGCVRVEEEEEGESFFGGTHFGF